MEMAASGWQQRGGRRGVVEWGWEQQNDMAFLVLPFPLKDGISIAFVVLSSSLTEGFSTILANRFYPFLVVYFISSIDFCLHPFTFFMMSLAKSFFIKFLTFALLLHCLICSYNSLSRSS